MQQVRQVELNWTPTKKQEKAWEILNDNTTTEFLYGGSAGSGKSLLGVSWLIINCLRYPGTRWMMCRAVLKDLKASTLLTFFEICERWNLKRDLDWKYNEQMGVITFIQTGSTIWLQQLAFMPSDPEFSGLGSREVTGIFCDEGDEVSVKGYNIAKSRIRFKLDKFCNCGGDLTISEVLERDITGKPIKWKCEKCEKQTIGLIPMILIATNPCKNFLYYDYYQLWKKEILPEYRKFLPALPTDNQFLSKHYIDNLNKLDGLSRQRLLHGDWEYETGDGILFEYQDIINMFVNHINIPTRSEKYLSVDIARAGKDKTVVFIFNDWHVEKIIVLPKYEKNYLRETRLALEEIRIKYSVPKENCIGDEDGLGGGIIDEWDIQGFINNSRPLEKKTEQNPQGIYTESGKHNYANLKSQCYFLLAKYIKEERISIYSAINEEVKALLISDLEAVKEHEPDKEKKLQVIPKEKMKEMLGRSNDMSDAMMMRMWFELKGGFYQPHIS